MDPYELSYLAAHLTVQFGWQISIWSFICLQIDCQFLSPSKSCCLSSSQERVTSSFQQNIPKFWMCPWLLPFSPVLLPMRKSSCLDVWFVYRIVIFSNCLYFYLPDLTTIISHANGWSSLLTVLSPLLTSIFNPGVQMFLLKHIRSQHLPVVSNNKGMPLRAKEIFVKIVCSTFWYLIRCCLLDTMSFDFPLSFLNFSHTDLLPFLTLSKHTSISWPQSHILVLLSEIFLLQ